MTRILALHPRLVVSDGAAAIDFYRAALGADEAARYTDAGGKIVHAEIVIGAATVELKDEGDGDPAPTSLNGTPVIMAINVDDADAVADAMINAGATVIHPIGDRPYGQRDGRLEDPFGHQWLISQQVEELTPAQIQQRTDAAQKT